MLTDPVRWTCPSCELSLDIRQFPVRCACGFVDTANTDHPVNRVVDADQQADRRQVCETCNKHRKRRCKLVDLGCRRTLEQTVASSLGTCPLDKWPPYLMPAITTRHCLYHVYPATASDQWQRNIETLVKYADVFNGRRIAAIACDDKSASFASASDLLSRHGFKCVEFRNDPQLRETVSFQQLLLRVADSGTNDAVWYGHTKGNVGHDGTLDVVTMWRNIMYRELLGNADACIDELRNHAAIGTHMMRWDTQQQSPFPSGIHNVNGWMFSGTFFWFRADVLFSDDNWRHVQQDRYGVEAWLGDRVPRDNALSVYQPISTLSDGRINPYIIESYPSADHYLMLEDSL